MRNWCSSGTGIVIVTLDGNPKPISAELYNMLQPCHHSPADQASNCVIKCVIQYKNFYLS